MIRGRAKKKKLVVAIGAAVAGCLALGTSVTLAGLTVTDDVNRTVYSAGGELRKSMFLDCETLWNVLGNEVYYMKCWHSSSGVASAWVLPSKAVTIDISGSNPVVTGQRTLYVFEYNAAIYNKVMFARVNPNGLTTSNIDSKIWNKTYDRSYSSGINYYYLDAWVTDTVYSHNYHGSISTAGAVTSYAADSNANS